MNCSKNTCARLSCAFWRWMTGAVNFTVLSVIKIWLWQSEETQLVCAEAIPPTCHWLCKNIIDGSDHEHWFSICSSGSQPLITECRWGFLMNRNHLKAHTHTVWCSAVQRGAVRCNMLQYVVACCAIWWSITQKQCGVALRCSLLQHVAMCGNEIYCKEVMQHYPKTMQCFAL